MGEPNPTPTEGPRIAPGPFSLHRGGFGWRAVRTSPDSSADPADAVPLRAGPQHPAGHAHQTRAQQHQQRGFGTGDSSNTVPWSKAPPNCIVP